MTDLEQVRAALELAANAQSHLPPTSAAPFAAKAAAGLSALDRLAARLAEMEAEIERRRKDHGELARSVKRALGFTNWPDHKDAFQHAVGRFVKERLVELEAQVAALRMAAERCMHNAPGTLVPDDVCAALDSDAGQHAAAVLRTAKAVSDFYVNGGSGPAREMDTKSEGLLVALTEAVEAWEGKS